MNEKEEIAQMTARIIIDFMFKFASLCVALFYLGWYVIPIGITYWLFSLWLKQPAKEYTESQTQKTTETINEEKTVIKSDNTNNFEDNFIWVFVIFGAIAVSACFLGLMFFVK